METIPTEEAFKQALEEGARERVLAVLRQGADVSARIAFGRKRLTPLAYCIRNGREDLAMLLLDHDAPLREHEARAYCEALCMSENKQSSLSILQLLLKKGLDTGISLRPLLMPDGSILSGPLLLIIARYGSVEHLELLSGVDMTLTSRGGVNVLMAAFLGDGRHTDIEKIDFLEQQGLHLWHATTLHGACNLYAFVNDAAGIRMLMKHEVDYNYADADGVTPLVWAAINQNAAGAELLMHAGAVVAPKDASLKVRERLFRLFLGLPTLSEQESRFESRPVYAERQLNEELLSLLFARTLHAEERARICNLALIAACAQKRRDLAAFCLSEGADIHTHTDGISLLGFVFARPHSRRVWHGRNKQPEKELISYLLEQGADPNCRAFGVQPALHTALASNASPEVVKLLLEHGAEKNQAIPTAVYYQKYKELEIILSEQPMERELLYKAFLGVRERGGAALNAEGLMWCKLREQGLIALTEDDTDALGIPLASILKERRISDSLCAPESSGDKGNSPVSRRVDDEIIILSAEEYEAVEQHISSGDSDFIREMLNQYPGFASAGLMLQGEDSLFPYRYALILAASHAQPEICRLLMEACNADDTIRTIIDRALRNLRLAEDGPAKTETLNILLKYAQQQQINVEDTLLWAPKWSDEHVALFLEYGSGALAAKCQGVTFLHRALSLGKFRVVQQLVRLGCSLEACSDNGFSCLHWACCGGNADCVRLCIEAGADVHRAIETEQGKRVTPVSLYSESWYKGVSPNASETLELLLQHGVSADWMDASGMTLLMHAIRTAHSAEMVKMLLQHGADVHLRDREGNTPLMLAVLEQEEEICRLLMEAGASPGDRNNAGCTAMDFARLMQEEPESEK